MRAHHDVKLTLITVKNPTYFPDSDTVYLSGHHFLTAINVRFYGKRKTRHLTSVPQENTSAPAPPTQILPYHDNILDLLEIFWDWGYDAGPRKRSSIICRHFFIKRLQILLIFSRIVAQILAHRWCTKIKTT